MLQFVEVRDDKVIQHVNIDETILSTEEIQNICPSPHFIQVFKPLRNIIQSKKKPNSFC